MTSEVFGGMFEGDSADTSADKFSLTLMGGRAEGLACADPGARTPICASGNLSNCFPNQLVTTFHNWMSGPAAKIGNQKIKLG